MSVLPRSSCPLTIFITDLTWPKPLLATIHNLFCNRHCPLALLCTKEQPACSQIVDAPSQSQGHEGVLFMHRIFRLVPLAHTN